MTQLFPDQLEFLDKHGIPLSAVFDASDLKKSEYKFLMKELGKLVAYGVSPCKKAGHTLRTRAGHCLQCDPLKLVYLLRHINTGMVYIAGSRSGSFLKVGSAVDAQKRISTLNSWAYASQNDWSLISSFSCNKAGSVEHLVQKGVSDFAYPAQYTRDGRQVDCLEIYKCNYSRILQAVETLEGFAISKMYSNASLEALFDSINEEYGRHNRSGNVYGVGSSGNDVERFSKKANSKDHDLKWGEEHSELRDQKRLNQPDPEKLATLNATNTSKAKPMPSELTPDANRAENPYPRRVSKTLLVTLAISIFLALLFVVL